MNDNCFRAPWGAPLAVMTGVCVVACLGFCALGTVVGVGVGHLFAAWGLSVIPSWVGWVMAAMALATLAGNAVFMVRGYVLTGVSLRIKRLGWESRIDLSELISVAADPDALRKSLRVWGNGGMFSFTGWFRNGKLGTYRAFVTDAKRAVVLRFPGKTMVVTPEDPGRFVNEVRLIPELQAKVNLIQP